MKSKLIFGGGMALLVGVILVLLCQFGPPGIKTGEDRVLSSMRLANGSKLYLVAHRTGHPIDAYEVTMYRIDHRTNVFAYYLGHEEPFWWGSSLNAESGTNKVIIRAYWQTVAFYSLSDDSLVWPGSKRSNTPSHKVDGTNVLKFFAKESK